MLSSLYVYHLIALDASVNFAMDDISKPGITMEDCKKCSQQISGKPPNPNKTDKSKVTLDIPVDSRSLSMNTLKTILRK